jgi:hypothetical protein
MTCPIASLSSSARFLGSFSIATALNVSIHKFRAVRVDDDLIGFVKNEGETRRAKQQTGTTRKGGRGEKT